MLSRLHAILFGTQVVDYNVFTTDRTFAKGQLLLSTRVTNDDAIVRHISSDLRSRGLALERGGRQSWHIHTRPGLMALAKDLHRQTRAVRA